MYLLLILSQVNVERQNLLCIQKNSKNNLGDIMKKSNKRLAAMYPPKDKITRGDIITAARRKKKNGGSKNGNGKKTKRVG